MPGQKPKSFAEKMERTGEVIADTAHKLARLKKSVRDKDAAEKTARVAEIQARMAQAKSAREQAAAAAEPKTAATDSFQIKGEAVPATQNITTMEPYDPAIDDGFVQKNGVWVQIEVPDYLARVDEIKILASYGFRVTKKTENQFVIEKNGKTAMIILKDKPRFIVKQSNNMQQPLDTITPKIIENLLA